MRIFHIQIPLNHGVHLNSTLFPALLIEYYALDIGSRVFELVSREKHHDLTPRLNALFDPFPLHELGESSGGCLERRF
jgi:hypothetical protein